MKSLALEGLGLFYIVLLKGVQTSAEYFSIFTHSLLSLMNIYTSQNVQRGRKTRPVSLFQGFTELFHGKKTFLKCVWSGTLFFGIKNKMQTHQSITRNLKHLRIYSRSFF